MRILYLGKFEVPWRTEVYVLHALQELGVEVVDHCMATRGGTYSNFKTLRKKAENFKPDIVLFSKPHQFGFDDFMVWCKQHGILTVTWIWDLYWGYTRSVWPPQFKADMLFTSDGGHDEDWKRYGANHFTLRQGIHAPEYIAYPRKRELWDLLFVGAQRKHSQHRYTLVNWMKTQYKSWKHLTHTRNLALNQALANCKIVLGDSYPSPNYWSNRIYEVLGRGGFLLHPYTDGLDAEFTEGVHYVGYERGNFDALADTVRYYLDHDKEREAIRVAGFEKCGQYTYTHRVQELLDTIAKHKSALV